MRIWYTPFSPSHPKDTHPSSSVTEAAALIFDSILHPRVELWDQLFLLLSSQNATFLTLESFSKSGSRMHLLCLQWRHAARLCFYELEEQQAVIFHMNRETLLEGSGGVLSAKFIYLGIFTQNIHDHKSTSFLILSESGETLHSPTLVF